MAAEDDEIVAEFLVESYENLDRFDEDLLALERDPADVEVLASIFRTVHTLKGTCGFFGFDRLEDVAHVAEHLLGRLRDGDLAVTGEIATALLATGDAVRTMLEDIEASGVEGPSDHRELVATLERIGEGERGRAPAPASGVGSGVGDEGDAGDDHAGEGEAGDDDHRLGALLVEAGRVSDSDVGLALHEQELGDPRPLGEILVGEGLLPLGDVEDALAAQAATRSIADSTIRVDVDRLDELMTLVGELVLARNQIVQLVEQEQDSVLVAASQRLNAITTELQGGVMRTRMQPIGNVWSKLPRVVRDLSLAVGDKQVELVVEGQDTELDKTILEAIKDPLTHLVRNAVDHGIETVADRESAGKPSVGRVTLRAYHEGGQVHIEIADDGAGIDPDLLKLAALSAGVITPVQAAALDDQRALELVFEPGLSTAAQVTNVSGRGVGMDVVRTNIERIGGTVEVSTEAGVGTRFRVTIPLTLAIIPALVVTSGGQRYAIPQLSLLELVRLEGAQVRTAIEMIGETPVYRLRGRLLPIVRLRDELGQPDDDRSVAEGRAVCSIVVLHADGHQFGLIVDEINDGQEIVVKPLGAHLKDLTLFAGATILGDGQVALIVDVLGVAQRAHVVSGARDRSVRTDEEVTTPDGADRRALLLVGVDTDGPSEGRRAAIALSDVARLETFDARAVERAGAQEVVQYRGEIMPLVRLGHHLGLGVSGTSSGRGSLAVVVHRLEGRDVGLVVDGILDIVDEHVEVERDRGGQGVLGSTIIQGRVTDVVDVRAIVAAAIPGHLRVGATS